MNENIARWLRLARTRRMFARALGGGERPNETYLSMATTMLDAVATEWAKVPWAEATEAREARLVQWLVDVVGWPMDVAWPNDPPPPVPPRMVAEAWSRSPTGSPDVDDCLAMIEGELGDAYMARWDAALAEPTEAER